MTKTILFLALIALFAPFTTAQFTQNFTSVQIGWGSEGVFVVPANITDPDGTTYFELERNTVDEPEGEWTLVLYNVDGTNTSFLNNNGDLVVKAQDGSETSIAGQIPSILGITGGELLNVLQTNIQNGVTAVYANPQTTNITTAEAAADADVVVDSIFALSALPSFFLTTYKTQAYQEVLASLNNAQAVSAAINASLTNGTSGANNVVIPLNLTSFNQSSLHHVHEIWATWRNETIDVILDSEVEGIVSDEYSAWLVNLEQASVAETVNADDWALAWVDDDGSSWSVQDINGQIFVVGADGSESNWTQEADWFVNNENGDLGAAIGSSVEDFVDAVVAGAGTNNGKVVINVGPDGFNWTWPLPSGHA